MAAAQLCRSNGEKSLSRILLIDDDEVFTAECEKVLQALGHEVLCISDTTEISAQVCTDAVSLVIVSSSDGCVNEIDVFRNLRLKCPGLHGILIADRDDFELVVAAINCGYSKVCIKPLKCTELKRAVAEIFKQAAVRKEATRMNALLPLYTLGQKLLRAVSEAEVYDELAEIVCREFKAPAVSVMILDDRLGALKIIAHRGLDQQYVDNLKLLPGERIAGKVFKTNTPAILNKDSQSRTAYSNLLARPEISAAISFPISDQNKVVGVINVSETRSGRSFSESDVEMLSIISDQAMMAISHLRAMKEREEQGRVRALLEQYVSPEVSKLLAQSRQDLMDVGSIKDLTVLFADIRNFTLLVQQISPRHLREFLNIFFEILTSVVFSHKGMLDKFMGDAALVVFGAPVNLTYPTLSAVTVAGELVKKFRDLQTSWAIDHPVFNEISLGVGISRGPLFLGNIGSIRRVDYTVIGTEVNVSQRLASEMDVGQILLTQQAYEDVGAAFSFESLGPTLLRGMTSTIEVYKLQSP